ncbi:MAG: hypothetical protein ACK4YT_14145, partial [Sphingomonas sp.]
PTQPMQPTQTMQAQQREATVSASGGIATAAAPPPFPAARVYIDWPTDGAKLDVADIQFRFRTEGVEVPSQAVVALRVNGEPHELRAPRASITLRGLGQGEHELRVVLVNAADTRQEVSPWSSVRFTALHASQQPQQPPPPPPPPPPQQQQQQPQPPQSPPQQRQQPAQQQQQQQQ